MTTALRLVFDDCLSRHAVTALKKLADFTSGSVEFAHLVDFNLSGEIDDDWVPRIAADKWIVVTTDRGKKPSRGGKLPALCQRHGLSYVMFSGSVHQRNTFDKIRALFDVWPALVKLCPGGSCHGYLIHGPAKARAQIKQVYPIQGELPPAVQKELGLKS